MIDTSIPSIRPDTADKLPVDTGEMDCSPLEDDRQGHDADEGGEESGEARASRSVPQPRLPSREERRLHELTHCPARPWCKHCVYGAAADYPHRTVVGEASKSEVPRVMLDYCFFKEDAIRSADEHTDKEEATVSLTALVMKETMCDSVWAYALKSKSVTEDPWIAEQIVDDLNTIGMGNNRIIVKTDQEASIVEMQSEIARRRSDVGTSLENSKVGDSNSNGKVERAIRDVGSMVRTLKSALTENANMTEPRHEHCSLDGQACGLPDNPMSSEELWKDLVAAHQGPEVAHRARAPRRDGHVQDPEDIPSRWQLRGAMGDGSLDWNNDSGWHVTDWHADWSL